MVATTAPWKTSRGRGRASSAGSTMPGSSAAANRIGVGDVRRVEDVAGELPHPLGQCRGARQHKVGAPREAFLRCPEALGVDALLGGEVVDAVIDDKLGVEDLDQVLGLRRVGPENRPAHAQSTSRPADLAPEQPPVQRSRCGTAVEGQHQRREDVEPIDGARASQPGPQAAPDPAQVARSELRPAQAQRLDEEDLVPRREAPHQMVLVDRQLGCPVGGADADDLAPLELHSGSNRSRIRSNSSVAVS